MLRRISYAFVAVAALSFATAATAQERPKMGLGVAANVFAVDAQRFTIAPGGGFVTVPIQLTPQLKVEPLIGINTDDEPSGTADRSDITIGAGLYALQRSAPNMDLYLGGRLILDFVSVGSTPGTPSDSGTNLKLAAVAGAEYFAAPKFSVGAEADLGFYSNSTLSGDNSGFFTAGLVFLRFYL